MLRSQDADEILTFDQKIPREYYLERWVEQTKSEFENLVERRCPVVALLLQEQIIEEKNLPEYQRSIKSMQEPTTGVILKLSEHAAEVFSGTSDHYQWTQDFAIAVEKRSGENFGN